MQKFDGFDFVKWMINAKYYSEDDLAEDKSEITTDLLMVKIVAPRFFNLLMDISGSEERAYIDDITKVDYIVRAIMSLLPRKPEHGKFWTDGNEILSEEETEIECLANLFDQLYGEGTVNTGYYDPKEDETEGCIDKYTGWHYVNFA